MKRLTIVLLFVSTLTATAQRVVPQYEINLHLDMAHKAQTASGVLMVSSLAIFTGALLFVDGNTQKGLYILSADCFFIAGAFQIASGHHNRQAFKLSK